jgi:hypothetical protein
VLDDPDIPPPGGVGIGRGAEYVVDVDGAPGGVVGAAGRGGGGAAGRAGGGVAGRAGAVVAGGVVGRAGGAAGFGAAGFAAAGFLVALALRAGAAFLAAFLRPAVFFLAAALRAVLRAAVLRVAALRAPARFFVADFRLLFVPKVAFARFIAEVAARFIFFRAVAAPDFLFLFVDFAMMSSSLPRLPLWTKRAHNKTHPAGLVA